MHFHSLAAISAPWHFLRTESPKPCAEPPNQQITAISFWMNSPLILEGRLAPGWDPVAGTQKNWTGWRMSLSVTEKMQVANDWGELSIYNHNSFLFQLKSLLLFCWEKYGIHSKMMPPDSAFMVLQLYFSDFPACLVRTLNPEHTNRL